MRFPMLETERLSLIKIDAQHVEDIYKIMSCDQVTAFYGMESMKEIEQAEKIVKMFQYNFLEQRGIRWGITLKENDDFIGTVGLNGLQKNNKRAEIGYEIHPDYWRKGYTMEAIEEILRYSFEELDLYRMGAVVYPENFASASLLKKIGFQEEGLLRGYISQGENQHDTTVFSLLKREWELFSR